MQRNGNRPVFLCLVLGGTLFLSFSGLGLGQVHPISPKPSIVHFGLSWSLVDGDVNRDDVLAIARIWATTVGIGRGLWEQSEARLFYNPAELLRCVNNGETDVIAMTTEEYLGLEKALKAEPLLILMQAGRFDVEYVILVHSSGGIKGLSDLQGKKAVFLSKGGRNSLASLWCDVTLAENGFPDKDHFFRETKEVIKSSQAVLPVFFRQSDAAIVPRSTFDTAAALNPQVGQQLKVLAASPRFVHTVLCIRASVPADMKNKYLDIALKLHETPDGLQAFTIFKIERVLRWEPRHFDSVRDLLRKNRRLALGDSSTRKAPEGRNEIRVPLK